MKQISKSRDFPWSRSPNSHQALKLQWLLGLEKNSSSLTRIQQTLQGTFLYWLALEMKIQESQTLKWILYQKHLNRQIFYPRYTYWLEEWCSLCHFLGAQQGVLAILLLLGLQTQMRSGRGLCTALQVMKLGSVLPVRDYFMSCWRLLLTALCGRWKVARNVGDFSRNTIGEWTHGGLLLGSGTAFPCDALNEDFLWS